MSKTRFIQIHPLAPPKPNYGDSCNGCRVCCAAEPCPVAHLLLRQWRGRCRALVWQEAERRYACGLVMQPAHYFRFIPQKLAPVIGRWLAKRIAAGQGGCG